MGDLFLQTLPLPGDSDATQTRVWVQWPAWRGGGLMLGVQVYLLPVLTQEAGVTS